MRSDAISDDFSHDVARCSFMMSLSVGAISDIKLINQSSVLIRAWPRGATDQHEQNRREEKSHRLVSGSVGSRR